MTTSMAKKINEAHNSVRDTMNRMAAPQTCSSDNSAVANARVIKSVAAMPLKIASKVARFRYFNLRLSRTVSLCARCAGV